MAIRKHGDEDLAMEVPPWMSSMLKLRTSSTPKTQPQTRLGGVASYTNLCSLVS